MVEAVHTKGINFRYPEGIFFSRIWGPSQPALQLIYNRADSFELNQGRGWDLGPGALRQNQHLEAVACFTL